MTDEYTHATDARTDEQTMNDVSHTNPYTDRPFGDAVAFRRGAVAADGGERGGGPRSGDDERDAADEATEEEEPETMEDVSHEAPDGDSPQRTFERGTEGRDDTV